MARVPLLTAAVFLGLFACGGAEENSEADDAALIDGRVAIHGELPAVVRVDEGCTAVKVGPKLLLLAAHCVRNDQGEAKLEGQQLSIQVQTAQGKTTSHRVEVEVARVHPRMTEVCKSAAGCKGSAAIAARNAPDIAIIKFKADIPGARIAPIDGRGATHGESLVAAGFGCTDGAFARGGDDGQLRTGGVETVAPTGVVHAGSPVSLAEAQDLAAVYLYSAGPGAKYAGAGLCPGDSGGPLFRKSADNKLSIVGVASSYTFGPRAADAIGKPVSNWHSRVDTSARFEVFQWLVSQGAQVLK